jgi:hypothetical protein
LHLLSYFTYSKFLQQRSCFFLFERKKIKKNLYCQVKNNNYLPLKGRRINFAEQQNVNKTYTLQTWAYCITLSDD